MNAIAELFWADTPESDEARDVDVVDQEIDLDAEDWIGSLEEERDSRPPGEQRLA